MGVILEAALEGLDHHLLALLVGNQQVADLKNGFEGLDDLVETACSTALLRELGDTEMRALAIAVLDDCHDLTGKGHLLEVKEVLCGDSAKYDVSVLVDLYIADTILFPLSKKICNFLSSASFTD